MERIEADVTEGSSPLARGLHSDSIPKRKPMRIIPARAGFTALLKAGAYTGKDHPRSRGVYEASDLGGARVWGSSPLARGLQPA